MERAESSIFVLGIGEAEGSKRLLLEVKYFYPEFMFIGLVKFN